MENETPHQLMMWSFDNLLLVARRPFCTDGIVNLTKE